MNVLIACEESQRVCIAFRAKGHNAFSCDIIDCSGGHSEWHIKQDVLPLLNGRREFTTCDGKLHIISGKWDLIIAHPPCTFLTVTGNRWFNIERYGEKAVQRQKKRDEAAGFFMEIANADCAKICIENPVGYMSSFYKKPTQIIQPYWFGDPERKATCLWLKGLGNLNPTKIVKPNLIYYKTRKGTDPMWHYSTMKLPAEQRAKERSKTFLGIAQAMAEQWGGVTDGERGSK